MPRYAFVTLIALATLVRVAALPLPGTEDTRVWKIWAYAASRDVTSVYGVGGDPPTRGVLHYRHWYTTVDYPPVALYEMALAGTVYRAISRRFDDTWHLTAVVKLPGLLAGLTLTALLFATVGRVMGDAAAARWAAAAYWANPATIVNGEVLGYLDPLVMLPAVAALVLLHRSNWVGAGVALALALLTKPQALLLLPAFALATWHTGRVRGAAIVAAAATVALAIGFVPFAAVGALPNVWLAFGSWYGRRDILSGNAANLWWIATWLARGYNLVTEYGWLGASLQPVRRILAISSWQEMGLPNPRPVGTAGVLAASGWALWRTRSRQDLVSHALCAAFIVHAFFVLGVAVHEHHLIMAVPLLALAAALAPDLRPLCYAVSAIAALNMNLFYGVGLGVGWALPRTLTPIDLSVLLAFANVAVLCWHARLLSRGCLPPLANRDAAVPAE